MRYALALACGFLGALQTARSQGAQTQEPASAAAPVYSLSVTSRLVVLDVTAFDAKGMAVTNLTRGEFRIFEDGAPQSIRSFEPPSAHTLSPGSVAAAAPDAQFNPEQPAAFGRSPVTVLLLDQLNTRFEDNSFARRSLEQYLRSQPALLAQPTELLDLYDTHLKTVLGFSRDRAALLAALAAEPVHNPWTLNVLGASGDGPLQRLDQSLRALETVTQNVARIPGRKNLVWVGGGYPSIDPQILTGAETAEVKSTIQHVTDEMLATRLTLYAVDPKTLLPGMSEITDPTQLAVFGAVGDSGSLAAEFYDANEAFDALGPLTGGSVVRGLNDLPHRIALAVQNGTEYYTLGYTPTSTSSEPGRLRRIRVECLRPGVTLQTRTGYYPEPAGKPASRETISYDLSTAAESAAPFTALHVTVTAAGGAGAPASAYHVHVGADELTWRPQADGHSVAAVEILAVWLDGKGHMIAHVLHGMHATAGAGTQLHSRDAAAEFNFPLDDEGKPLPAKVTKAKRLRFIVRDAATGKMGSFELTL